MEFVEKVVDILAVLRNGDPFCKDFKNTLIDDAEIAGIVEKGMFMETKETPEISRLLALVNLTLWHYAILIQGGLRMYSQELHGPYTLGKEEILFVREYFNLKPALVWAFTSSLPFDKIAIYEIYNDLEIHVDMLGHYWTSSQPYKKLSRVAIIVDDKQALDFADVETLYRDYATSLQQGASITSDFARADWTRKWIELGYFGLKPLMDAVAEDWRPVAEVMTQAQSKEEFERADAGGERHLERVGRALATLPKDKAAEEIANMHLKTVYHEWR